jgi:hypothetical protein
LDSQVRFKLRQLALSFKNVQLRHSKLKMHAAENIMLDEGSWADQGIRSFSPCVTYVERLQCLVAF